MSGMRSSLLRYIQFRLFPPRQLITKFHIYRKELMELRGRDQVEGGKYANDPLGWRLGL